LVGLFSKLAVVPFQAWLTDFSEGAPAPWAGFIVAASPLTVIGFLLRFVINTNVSQIPHLKLCLVIFAALSIIWGSFVALKQEELKRFTTCLVVAQTGFILLILALGITPQGLSANTIETIFIVLAANTILSLGAFSTLATLTNNENNSIQLANLQGLAKTNPLTSLTLSLFFLGLAGIPITVGFVARYRALWTVIQTGSYTAIAGLLIVSVVYAFSCLRPVRVLFAKEQTTQTLQPTLTVPAMIAITLCVFLTISLGVNPSLLIKIAGLIEMSLQ
jgi:NADH-quinone oxidoreductase subunit N